MNTEAGRLNCFKRDGYKIIPSLISLNECDLLCAELTPLFEQLLQTSKSRIGGVRNLLGNNSLVSTFANSTAIISLLEQTMGKPVSPVRAIFFDKMPNANWLVPWHQDLAIAVVKQTETSGFSGWSVKDGIHHVHPPVEILAGMITLRLHFDDCDHSNGALKVIAGSHAVGKIPAGDIARWTSTKEQIICKISKGGALLMQPLLLHASSVSDSPHHRRVLHIEYATQKLPNGLKWFAN